ncbi:MAG TPA: glutamate mutase L [Ktedonobacteraceae bacterium]|nr:glutamate mutase L [Ktedonobacteraceae bacterium]
MYTETKLEEGPGQTMNRNPASANSILVVDCGSVFTKVSLLGLVENQYRLMARGEAPTSLSNPDEDITRGIIQAIQRIEHITGRQLIADGQMISPERPDGNGVDVFVATVSVGGTMRLVVLGGVSSALNELATQAVSGLYAETYAVPSPAFQAASSSNANPPASWTPERLAAEWKNQLQRMQELQPDAVLIVGNAEGPAGAAPLQEACQLIINAVQSGALEAYSPANTSRRLPVLYAGAPQYVEAVRTMLKGFAEVTRIDTLTSQAQLGPVSMTAMALYERDIIQSIPGYERMRSWSATTPVATASSLSSLVRFLAQHYAMNVTAVDVGGTNTTVMMASERGEFIPIVDTGIGIGPGIGAILQKAGPQRIARWLPFSISNEELQHYARNCMQHPQVLPANQRELHIAQAFAREAMILVLEAAGNAHLGQFEADLILATGGVLAHAPKFGQAMLMLLDALQPRGVTSIILDSTMLITQLGAVATVAPIAAVQVNENDAVAHRLGTCVVPYGTLPPGQNAIRVGVEYSNGRQVTVDVKSGSLEIIPLRINEQALLTLYPAPTVDVGLGPGERARAAEEIDGGLVGLVIDARGRPLVLPNNEAERQARLLQWMQVIGA